VTKYFVYVLKSNMILSIIISVLFLEFFSLSYKFTEPFKTEASLHRKP